MADQFKIYVKPWLKQHLSVLSKRYNKPKKHDGHKNLITGEAHKHYRENTRRWLQDVKIRYAHPLLKEIIDHERIHTGA